jgi:hypothetical protein
MKIRTSAIAYSKIGIIFQKSFRWSEWMCFSCHSTTVARTVERRRKKTPTPIRLFMLAPGMHGKMMWLRKRANTRTIPSSTKE